MDRSLVQVKQGRSNPIVGASVVSSLATSTARNMACLDPSRRSSGCVRPWRAGIKTPSPDTSDAYRASEQDLPPARRSSADPIAGPMTLVRRNCRFGMAGALRDRLHERPLVNRATTNNGLRRSFTL
jgi:hypothetical protein